MEIKLTKKPQNPTLIEGFPGFGLIGTITTEFLIEHLKAEKIGVGHDIRKDMYDALPTFDMNTLKDFHNSHISGTNRVVMVLGSKEDLDLEVLKNYGEIVHLTLEDVFGY